MSQLAPPPAPPWVALGDDDGKRRLQLRLRQLVASTLTVLIAGWCCTLGPIPAIIAIMIAKHVLVAILVMGLGVDATRRVET